MPDSRSYDRYGDRPVRMNSSAGPQPGISRSGARPSGAQRPAGSRPAGSRPAGSRPASAQRGASSRPAGSRPPQQGQRPAGSRPPQGRRPQQGRRRRRRGVQPRFFIILAVLIALIVALVIFLNPGGKDETGPRELPTVQPQGNGLTNVAMGSETPDPNAPQTEAPADEFLAGGLDEEEEEEEDDSVPEISTSEQAQISPEQLMINNSLPSDWMNVLLLGTDERNLNEPARTDTMIIASINTSTGEVKLTSLLRDVAVKYEDLPKYSNTYYRLNAANYFGGPLYAVKTVNQLLEMNIQYYVSVNFYGFTRIAEALGGIDVDITEAEMNEINKKQYHQARAAATAGVDESDIQNETLTTFGANTHLNGRQTLAYARVRYVDNDYTRTERQRTVISKLMQKLRGKNVAEIGMLLSSLAGNVSTNMDLNSVLQIAMTVLNSDFSSVETLLLPENGTYTLDRRNDKEMFFDTDWDRNAMTLYNFIYA